MNTAKIHLYKFVHLCWTTTTRLLEKVTADDVGIGLGYVCVRNRVGEESFEDARAAEAQLFKSHSLLKQIDKAIVGIPNLAKKLVDIQASILAKCLPSIIRQINDKLNFNLSELNQLPRSFTSASDAIAVFMRILGSAKESLRKIMITGEFDEFPDDDKMHCTARLSEMISKYSDDLQRNNSCLVSSSGQDGKFLMEEVSVLADSEGIWLPNFLPRSVFLRFLRKKVGGINPTPAEFVEQVWDYLSGVVSAVLMHHCRNYPQLHSLMRRAGESATEKMKKEATERMTEMVEMEKAADYTCNPEYMSTWNVLMSYQKEFMKIVEGEAESSVLRIPGFWEVDVGHLRKYRGVAQQAFDTKMRLTAYWKVVLRRMVDAIALYVVFSVQKLVKRELEAVVVEEMMAPGSGKGGIERMLEETPSLAIKREKLTKSISLLKESKEVVSKVMDFVV